MLTADDARHVSAELRDRFHSPEAFEESWQRCFKVLRKPSLDQVRNWLLEDLERDQIVAGGLPREPLLPVRSKYDVSDCPHCGGVGYVRRDVPVDDSQFGRAVPCPACSNPDHAAHCDRCRASGKSQNSEPFSEKKSSENRRDFVGELAKKWRAFSRENRESVTPGGPTVDELAAAMHDLAAYRRSPDYLAALEQVRAHA